MAPALRTSRGDRDTQGPGRAGHDRCKVQHRAAENDSYGDPDLGLGIQNWR